MPYEPYKINRLSQYILFVSSIFTPYSNPLPPSWPVRPDNRSPGTQCTVSCQAVLQWRTGRSDSVSIFLSQKLVIDSEYMWPMGWLLVIKNCYVGIFKVAIKTLFHIASAWKFFFVDISAVEHVSKYLIIFLGWV